MIQFTIVEKSVHNSTTVTYVLPYIYMLLSLICATFRMIVETFIHKIAVSYQVQEVDIVMLAPIYRSRV